MRYAYLPERRGCIGVGLTGAGSQHRHGDVVDVSLQVGERHPDLYRCEPELAVAEVAIILPAPVLDYAAMSAAEVKALARAAGATAREAGSKTRAIDYLTR